MSSVPWLSADDQHALASISACADALTIALAAWPTASDTVSDRARLSLPVGGGELLVMPSAVTGHVGVKVLTVADALDRPGVARIQGVHVQFDSQTLAPRAILDGIALTNTRTAAVSVVALRALADPASTALLVFGSGPQAGSHIRGICAEWPITSVRIVSRRLERSQRLAKELGAELVGVEIQPSATGDVSVAEAHIIVCATTSAVPVFTSEPRDGSATVAVGSHSPTARELPGALLQRSYIAVEDRAVAARDAGDIALAIAEGFLTASDIDADLVELVRSPPVDVDGPRVFKSVGMAWQDAVVAHAILART